VHQSGALFEGLWLEAEMAARLSRVGARGSDASDADQSVVQIQSHLDVGSPGSWHRLQAGAPLGEVVAMASTILKL